MANIFFITEAFLKGNGIMNGNIDAAEYTGLIQGCAKSFIKKQIGSYFFNDLLSKYNAQTLSADEILLVEKMQFAIAWRLKSEAGTTLTYQLKNKGYQKQNDDNAESLELKEVTYLADSYLQKAILEELEIKEFLIANKDLYPAFLSTENKDSTIKNSCSTGNNYNEGTGLFII